MANPAAAILRSIQSGNLDQAMAAIASLNDRSANPEVCNAQTLSLLNEARRLTIVRRAHILQNLRSLEAARFYRNLPEAHRSTWQMDG